MAKRWRKPVSERKGLRFQIETRKFDSLDINTEGISFVKCDVEGAELMVFKGMKTFLESETPSILVEIQPQHTARFGWRPEDVASFLGNLGYLCFVLVNGKLSAASEISSEKKNYFFVHSAEITHIEHHLHLPLYAIFLL